MKTIHNTKIIGIDHGYGNMKTANCCFPTGITAYDHEPLFTADMLVYGRRYYLIGEGHKEFAPDKIKDEDYYVLTPDLDKRAKGGLQGISDKKCRGGVLLQKGGLPPLYRRCAYLSAGVRRHCELCHHTERREPDRRHRQRHDEHAVYDQRQAAAGQNVHREIRDLPVYPCRS